VPFPLNMRFLLALRAIFFVLLLPGTVAGYIPFGILSTAGRLRARELSLSSVGASILAIAGTVVLLRCVWDFFAYALLVLVLFHLFVVLYEEPALTPQFGESYRAYRRAVPRWGFTTRPFQEGTGAADRTAGAKKSPPAVSC